jgi:hypothetical protein
MKIEHNISNYDCEVIEKSENKALIQVKGYLFLVYKP